jgi:hypothetical protein
MSNTNRRVAARAPVPRRSHRTRQTAEADNARGRQPRVRNRRVGVIAVDQALHLFILAMLAVLLG